MRPDADCANKKESCHPWEKNSHGSAAFLFEVVMPSLWSELHHWPADWPYQMLRSSGSLSDGDRLHPAFGIWACARQRVSGYPCWRLRGLTKAGVGMAGGLGRIALVNKYTVDVCHLQQFTDLCSTGFFFRASILSGHIFSSILMLLFYTSPEVYTIIGMVSNSNRVDSSAMTIIQLHPVL